MRSAAIYARISLDRDGDGLGVARQIEDCEAEAAKRGWTVGEVYVDDDISAYSGKRRPAYERLLADLRDGLRDGVIVWHLDRLHRRPIELEEFAQVCLAAGATVTTLHGEVDFGNGDGLLVARIMAAVAANESDAKGRRMRRKNEQLAAQGLPHGGNRAFGFEPDYSLRPAEAAVVAELAERFLAGETLMSLTKWLTETGVPTVRGGPWRPATVRGLLAAPRNSAQCTLRGEIVGPAAWPAIITVEQTAQIRAILDDPARRTNRSARSYLLSGLVRCEQCGDKMVANPKRGVARYICRKAPEGNGCGRNTINAQALEELVSEAVLYRLDTPELADALAGRNSTDADTANLADQVAADDAQLHELAGLYADRAISAKEWMAAREPIETRIKAARRQIAQRTNTAELARHVGNGAELRAGWATMNLDRRRAVIRTLVDHVVITPRSTKATAFDPGRVSPLWLI